MPSGSSRLAHLEDELSSFDAATRRASLLILRDMADAGEFALPVPLREVNLHIHTFYSFNAHGWSPTRVAWEARKYGLEVAGKVDFDVLDGMEEFLDACEVLRLKSAVGLETRVFIRDYQDKVINSPGEPGIAYFMAAGCTRMPAEGSDAACTLDELREKARSRTRGLMERVNGHLDPVRLDYERDVLPLTPSGNATERHLLAAYNRRAREVYPETPDLASFWTRMLEIEEEAAAAIVRDPVKLEETMRSKLMKIGGVAYVQPNSGSFPSLESVIAFAKDTGAIPCATWLDGTNPGEDSMDEMFSLLESKGVAAVNIVPDRNWNIKDPAEKELKLRKLEEMVQAARAHGFPLCAGTEMNKLGLPFVDDFQAPELQPYVGDFIAGAHFFWGHTLLDRYADYGYFSPKVEDAFGEARRRRNKFFELAGRLPIPSRKKLSELRDIDLDPEQLLVWLQDKSPVA